MTSTHWRILTRIVASMLVVFGLVGVAQPAKPQAQELAGPLVLNPNTPTSSDRGIRPMVVASGLQSEDGFEGTGSAPFDAYGETESVDEVWRLWSLAPASSGIAPQTIIGADTRVRINPTTTYPARAVVLVTFTGGRCTGWLYGMDIVATAGHCVHSGAGGTWRANVRVYPGRNGASSPYGSCTARRLHSVTGWTQSSSELYDYGAIKLNCTIGNTVGWFGYWWQSASLTGLPSLLSGYPGDKPLEQWRSSDQIRTTQARQVFYLNDSIDGMSGGPIYYNRPAGSAFCAGQCSMAIHAYGLHGAAPHSTYNHATRIVEPVFNNLKAWKDAP